MVEGCYGLTTDRVLFLPFPNGNITTAAGFVTKSYGQTRSTHYTHSYMVMLRHFKVMFPERNHNKTLRTEGGGTLLLRSTSGKGCGLDPSSRVMRRYDISHEEL